MLVLVQSGDYMREGLKLFTHDGVFHADEVFATALFTLYSENITVTRGSDQDIPEGDDWIVFDIGGGILDHHTPENKRNNGFHPDTEIPYASCGLVWRCYYRPILKAQKCPPAYYDYVYRRLEKTLIIGIDAFDNGINPLSLALDHTPSLSEEEKKKLVYESSYGFTVSQMIKDFNPTWNSDFNVNDAFRDAVSFARDILLNRLDSIISQLDARDYVSDCIAYSSHHIMIMDRFAPWENLVSGHPHDPKAADIWFVVYPAMRGGWNVQCALNDVNDRTSFRKAMPAEWYGLRNEELQQATGIAAARFCHISGFLAGCDTEEDALALAALASR